MSQEYTITLTDDQVTRWTAYCTWTQEQSRTLAFPPIVSVENPQAILQRLVDVQDLSMTSWAAQHPETL